MHRLSRWLVPYASDYTGVAASLYDLGGMTVFCDAGCCTDHYVLNDEPRWRDRPGLCLSAHLRSTEAVLGVDRALVERICAFARDIDRLPPVVAVLGTPVPGILGTDLAGIAAEIEAQLGVPTFGFATSGFKTYDHGVDLAARSLMGRFVRDPAPAPDPRRVNILGATPLDFGDVGNEQDFARLFESAGWTVGLQFPMGASLADLERAAEAGVNVAVSASGLRVARWFERRYGTPWIAGCPAGAADGPLNRALLLACEAAACGRRPSGWWRAGETAGTGKGTALVIADQVVAESVRALLQARDPMLHVAVASPFSWDRTHAAEHDFAFGSEEELVEKTAALAPASLVADPTLETLALMQPGCAFAPLVHCAVSGKLHWDDSRRLATL